jgi:hypothetical protein
LGNEINDSHQVQSAGQEISKVHSIDIPTPMGFVSLFRWGGESANTMKFRIDNIPHVYVIPAFMDEVAVSLANAAGIGRTGDYYTMAVLNNPSVVFTMAANQLLQDRTAGKDIQSLCNFYRIFQSCFGKKEQGFHFMMNTCQEVLKVGPVSLSTPVEAYNCDNLVRDYGKDLQYILDATIGKYKDKNTVYGMAYSAYSSMAKQLQQGNASSLPPNVEQQIEKSIHDALQPVELGFSQLGDEGDTAAKLADPNFFVKYLIQKPGMFWQDVMSSIGKTPLVRTLIVQNEITIFLSFFLLPLIVLVTFLTNNFRYLTEYAFGYLLLKLQIPLWVVGNYLATGHVFTNLLASPTINGYLIALANGGVNDSNILVNTVTAGVMSLGIGSLFLFGKSAAGGINQGIAAGGEILKGAMEVAKITAAAAGTVFGGVAGLAGAAGAAGAAGGAAGSAAGGTSSVLGAVGNALQGIANTGTFAQMITSASKGIGGIYRAVQSSRLAKMPRKTFDVITNRLGQFMSNKSGEIEEMRFKSPDAFNEFENTLRESGYETKVEKEEGGDYVFTISNKKGQVRYRSSDGREFKLDPEKGDRNKQIPINKDIFKEKPKNNPNENNKDSNKNDNNPKIILPDDPDFKI